MSGEADQQDTSLLVERRVSERDASTSSMELSDTGPSPPAKVPRAAERRPIEPQQQPKRPRTGFALRSAGSRFASLSTPLPPDHSLPAVAFRHAGVVAPRGLVEQHAFEASHFQQAPAATAKPADDSGTPLAAELSGALAAA